MGKQTGHTWKEVEDFFLRDKFMNAHEAKEFGLIDEIMDDPGDIVVLDNPENNVSLITEGSGRTRLN
jgi:ATP-dependent Clp protease protease subunit